jgi:hypothetical protein
MIIQEMTLEECHTELTRAKFGRLACSRANQPYIVPIRFVFDQGDVYSFSMLGQKVEWMRANPLVCLQVDRVTGADDWTSVLVFGRYDELQEPDDHTERRRAHELLQRTVMWWQPGSTRVSNRNGDGDADPIFFRIIVSKLTGHRGVPDARAGSLPLARNLSRARSSQTSR